jgi:hypothetical protein
MDDHNPNLTEPQVLYELILRVIEDASGSLPNRCSQCLQTHMSILAYHASHICIGSDNLYEYEETEQE